MIIQRRNFLIGLASSLAAPVIVKAANIMPVKVLFDPKITIQEMFNYYASAKVDVLYGWLKIGDAVKISCLEDEFKITAISANELYLNSGSLIRFSK